MEKFKTVKEALDSGKYTYKYGCGFAADLATTVGVLCYVKNSESSEWVPEWPEDMLAIEMLKSNLRIV